MSTNHQKATNAYQERHLQRGLCVSCSKPVADGRSKRWCADHLDQRNLYTIQYRSRPKPGKAMCFTCDLEVAPGSMFCIECNRRILLRKARARARDSLTT